MSRFLIYICTAFFSFAVSFAQESRTDSLLNQTEVLSGEELGSTYYALAQEWEYANPDSALTSPTSRN